MNSSAKYLRVVIENERNFHEKIKEVEGKVARSVIVIPNTLNKLFLKLLGYNSVCISLFGIIVQIFGELHIILLVHKS